MEQQQFVKFWIFYIAHRVGWKRIAIRDLLETELNKISASSLMFWFESFDGLIASIFLSGKLARKPRVRMGQSVNKKIILSVEEILETLEEQDQPSAIIITRWRKQKLLLQEKLDTIRNLDEEISQLSAKVT